MHKCTPEGEGCFTVLLSGRPGNTKQGKLGGSPEESAPDEFRGAWPFGHKARKHPA